MPGTVSEGMSECSLSGPGKAPGMRRVSGYRGFPVSLARSLVSSGLVGLGVSAFTLLLLAHSHSQSVSSPQSSSHSPSVAPVHSREVSFSFVTPSLFLSVTISLSLLLSACLSECLFDYLSDCLSDCRSVCLSVCLSVFLSLSLSLSCFLGRRLLPNQPNKLSSLKTQKRGVGGGGG